MDMLQTQSSGWSRRSIHNDESSTLLDRVIIVLAVGVGDLTRPGFRRHVSLPSAQSCQEVHAGRASRAMFLSVMMSGSHGSQRPHGKLLLPETNSMAMGDDMT